MPIPLPGRTESTLYCRVQKNNHVMISFNSKELHNENIIYIFVLLIFYSDYLLYVSDVHQLDDFILLGGAGSRAGALKAQVTDGERDKTSLAERRPEVKQAGKQNRRHSEWTSCQLHIQRGEEIYRSEVFSGGGLSYLIHC